MEKSIESIWKEGFLKNDALVAPKLNDLYNQKSTHIIDKFKRMFKINLIAVVVGSLLFLVISFFIGIPIMGIGFFLILTIIVIVNKRLSLGLDQIDKNNDSYHYISAFNDWIKEQISVNRKMARWYYPLFFLSFVLGFWYSSFDEQHIGRLILNKLAIHYPDIYLFFGIPIVGILGVVSIMGLLAYFGGRIYNWDINMVYGGLLRKLDEIIQDMEELRN